MPNRYLFNHLFHIIGDEEEITRRILKKGDNNLQDFEEDEFEGDDIPFYNSLTGKHLQILMSVMDGMLCMIKGGFYK